MNKKKIIIAIFIVSIILLIGFTIYYCIKNSTYEISNRQLNETSLNKVQETMDEINNLKDIVQMK